MKLLLDTHRNILGVHIAGFQAAAWRRAVFSAHIVIARICPVCSANRAWIRPPGPSTQTSVTGSDGGAGVPISSPAGSVSVRTTPGTGSGPSLITPMR